MQPKPESSAEEGATDAGANRPDAGASRGTFESGDIEGVVVRDLRKFVDARGWLAELFRDDEVDAEFRPAMAYISTTKPGARRAEPVDEIRHEDDPETVFRLDD